jgi:2-methylcitrate dehydratase PrpD
MDPIEVFLEATMNKSFEDFNPEAINSAKSGLIDFVGVMLGGVVSQQTKMCVDLIERWGGVPEATVLATGRKVPRHLAMLANCTAGGALGYDEVHERARLHGMSAVVPAAMAFSEMTRIDGKSFITSIIIGYELVARMGLAINAEPGATGFATTFQGASLSTALVGSKLLGLDLNITRNALGIAYSMVAGNQEVIREGVDMMVIQQGLSGMNGIIALEMAKIGISGPKEILSGKYGYFSIYHPGRHSIEAFTKDLGNKWEIENMSIKPVPCCKLIQTALQASLDLRYEYNLSPEQIAEVQVGVISENFGMICDPLDVKKKPKTIIDALYSVPYVLSVALTKGEVGLADFTLEGIARPEVLEFAKLVNPVKDPNLSKSKGTMPAWVNVFLKDGRKLTCHRDAVKGNPAFPMTDEERNAKFFNCLFYAGYPKQTADRLLKALEQIENMVNVSDLIGSCRKDS